MRIRLLIPLLLVSGMLAVPAVSQAYLTGVANEDPSMFASPYYTRLLTHQPPSLRISRYIAPYDVAAKGNSFFLDRFVRWYRAAKGSHVQMLVAFYHSQNRRLATRLPSVATYQTDVAKAMKLFPDVTSWQPWNEANRGYIPRVLASPSAVQAAQYYKALRTVCPKVTRHCTIVALDALDQNNAGPYIAQFMGELRRLRVPIPRLWGLHNYEDTNRFTSSRTRAVLRQVPGEIWLTETGGLVQFDGAFPNRKGSGNRRAARVLSYMFRLAGSNPRITRLYIFAWSGAGPRARFDSGLVDPRGVPRPGYVVVCRQLHASACSGIKVDARH